MEKKNILESKIGLKLTMLGKKSKILALQRFSMNDHPITPEQFTILAALVEQDGMYQSQIAHWTMKDRPNITRLTNILEKMKLVSRHADVNKRKVYKISITDKGREVYKRIVPTILDVWKDTVEGISDIELKTTLQVLHKIRLNLDNNINIQY